MESIRFDLKRIGSRVILRQMASSADSEITVNK